MWSCCKPEEPELTRELRNRQIPGMASRVPENGTQVSRVVEAEQNRSTSITLQTNDGATTHNPVNSPR